MFVLFMLIIALVVLYIDALICLAVKHKFNWKLSVISAIFWPITLVVVITAIVKETKDY